MSEVQRAILHGKKRQAARKLNYNLKNEHERQVFDELVRLRRGELGTWLTGNGIKINQEICDDLVRNPPTHAERQRARQIARFLRRQRDAAAEQARAGAAQAAGGAGSAGLLGHCHFCACHACAPP